MKDETTQNASTIGGAAKASKPNPSGTITIDYDNLNMIPALTWNHLKMNSACLETEINAKIIRARDEKTLPGETNASGESKIIHTREAQSKLELMSGIGSTVLSSRAAKGNDALITFFAAVVDNSEADDFLIDEFEILEGEKLNQPIFIRFEARSGESALARYIVHAGKDSSATVIILCSSPETADSDPSADGFCACKTFLFAEKNSRVHLIKVQLAGSRITLLDETEILCDDNASVQLTRIELGSFHSFQRAEAKLLGDGSSFKSDTAYLLGKTQTLDMTHTVIQRGKNTDCRMNVSGVISGRAEKTYRGTIDFVCGCRGSVGDEQEETLILSDKAVNKSIPVILCAEADISGTHGSTIGRIGEDELFYMKSRGINEIEAAKMLARAKIARAAKDIPDDSLREKIARKAEDAVSAQI